MEWLVSIGSYDPTAGLHLEWSDGFEIEVQVHSGEVLIRANKAGLVSLAQHLLTLGRRTGAGRRGMASSRGCSAGRAGSPARCRA